jgi:PAS domain S-box-containing protein
VSAMTRPPESGEHALDLRQRALAIVDGNPSPSKDALGALSGDDIWQMLHELRVHQIELEMQNEELRRAQLEIDAARARYFELYDLAPVGYCTVNEATGTILQANLAAATLLGIVRSGLIGQPITRFILGDDQDSYYQHRRRLMSSDETQWCDLRMRAYDGTPFWVQLAAITASEADGTPVLRIMLNDISERKRVEAERIRLDAVLQEKNLELENARLVADKANRAKSDFLSGMSHELRTPLSAILGFAQLLESGKPAPTPTQQRNIDQILKAGWYLLELINEILDLALIESGKLSLSVEPVSLQQVLLECENMIQAQRLKHGVAVSFPQLAVNHVLSADRIRVKQILINLLSNAIKYNTEHGTVDVECSVCDAQLLRISVRDSGVGLAAEQLAQLFQPFNRLGQDAKAEQGTGIGLVVCKRLVELMGGVIGVESTVGKGSVFWFELPLASEAQGLAATAAGDDGVAPPVDADAPLRTLLYVEDNPANLLLVEEIVGRRSDLRFISATDGLAGIRLAHTAMPDVILMDINLPGISGLEALKILISDPATAPIPVVALSANAMPHDIAKGLEAGFFRYLTKPIKINELMAALDLALNTPRA